MTQAKRERVLPLVSGVAAMHGTDLVLLCCHAKIGGFEEHCPHRPSSFPPFPRAVSLFGFPLPFRIHKNLHQLCAMPVAE